MYNAYNYCLPERIIQYLHSQTMKVHTITPDILCMCISVKKKHYLILSSQHFLICVLWDIQVCAKYLPFDHVGFLLYNYL